MMCLSFLTNVCLCVVCPLIYEFLFAVMCRYTCRMLLHGYGDGGGSLHCCSPNSLIQGLSLIELVWIDNLLWNFPVCPLNAGTSACYHLALVCSLVIRNPVLTI